MKKLILSLIFFISSSVFALDEQTVNSGENVITIDQNSYFQGKNLPKTIEIQNDSSDEKEKIKHLPWSMTEKRIEYDSNGQAQFTPYALNDLNIQY